MKCKTRCILGTAPLQTTIWFCFLASARLQSPIAHVFGRLHCCWCLIDRKFQGIYNCSIQNPIWVFGNIQCRDYKTHYILMATSLHHLKRYWIWITASLHFLKRYWIWITALLHFPKRYWIYMTASLHYPKRYWIYITASLHYPKRYWIYMTASLHFPKRYWICMTASLQSMNCMAFGRLHSMRSIKRANIQVMYRAQGRRIDRWQLAD